MKKLSILADENIPNLNLLCADWADIKTALGRNICARDLEGVDILLVRSVTKVNAELLANSSVKFVGSATIGIDHIDTDYLTGQGIGFAHAPGSNANGVVDYVMSIILDRYDNTALQNLTVGVVGHGNVGGRLARCLNHYSIPHIVYDPLITPSTKKAVNSHFVETLDEIMNSEIISLHVPLTNGGEYPSYHLFNSQRLSQLGDNALLINSSRGPVVNNPDLKSLLFNRSDLNVALDVWEGEPDIDTELYSLCMLGTPHIAGYSLDGKHRGASMIVSAAMQYFNLNKAPDTDGFNTIKLEDLHSLDDYRNTLSTIYSAIDEAALFEKQLLSSSSVAEIFDRYRKNYPARREINYDG